MLQVAYALLLEVFLYRNFNVISQADASAAIQSNKELFVNLFAREFTK